MSLRVRLCFPTAAVLLLAFACPRAAGAAVAVTNAPPALHNVFRLSPRILSGSQPEGDASFAWLAREGVRTLVSVDGARPDVERARRHGLRYVHLPMGYDGVPMQRVAELARLATVVPGPFYVHCHHGKHRGPAAAAVLCQATEQWSTSEAEAFLKQAGTSPEYPGLYRSVAAFHPPDSDALSALSGTFPEVASTSGMVQAMVNLDLHMERLRDCRQHGWGSPPGHPDLSAAHEAAILRDQLSSLGAPNTPGVAGEDFARLLAQSEKAADELRRLLEKDAVASAGREEVDAAFRRLATSCTRCHTKWRN